MQPYDTEKGAGTMNPHTFLRAIGPEPWSVAYPEPCRRPTDGRFGENPKFTGLLGFRVSGGLLPLWQSIEDQIQLLGLIAING